MTGIVENWAKERQIRLKILHLPVSAHTAEDASRGLGCDLGQIAKSLIFYNVSNREPLLVIASGINRVDKDKLSRYLGFRIKTAGPEYVKDRTGFPVGGVPPFAHKTPLRTIFDPDLLKFDYIWAAAGSADSLFSYPPAALAKLIQAELVPIC